MPELFFVNEDKRINIDVGANLRKTAIASEIGVYSNIIDPPNEIEKKKLKKKLASDPNLRLACQLNVKNDLKIYTT